MKFRVTSVASEEVAPILRSVSVWLEDALNAKLDSFPRQIGIDQFVIVFVAVDSDYAENCRFAKKHEDAGRYKDARTGEIVRFMSIAIQLDPGYVMALDQTETRSNLTDAVSDRLGRSLPRSHKGFDSSKFSGCLLSVINALA